MSFLSNIKAAMHTGKPGTETPQPGINAGSHSALLATRISDTNVRTELDRLAGQWNSGDPVLRESARKAYVELFEAYTRSRIALGAPYDRTNGSLRRIIKSCQRKINNLVDEICKRTKHSKHQKPVAKAKTQDRLTEIPDFEYWLAFTAPWGVDRNNRKKKGMLDFATVRREVDTVLKKQGRLQPLTIWQTDGKGADKQSNESLPFESYQWMAAHLDRVEAGGLLAGWDALVYRDGRIYRTVKADDLSLTTDSHIENEAKEIVDPDMEFNPQGASQREITPPPQSDPDHTTGMDGQIASGLDPVPEKEEAGRPRASTKWRDTVEDSFGGGKTREESLTVSSEHWARSDHTNSHEDSLFDFDESKRQTTPAPENVENELSVGSTDDRDGIVFEVPRETVTENESKRQTTPVTESDKIELLVGSSRDSGGSVVEELRELMPTKPLQPQEEQPREESLEPLTGGTVQPEKLSIWQRFVNYIVERWRNRSWFRWGR